MAIIAMNTKPFFVPLFMGRLFCWWWVGTFCWMNFVVGGILLYCLLLVGAGVAGGPNGKAVFVAAEGCWRVLELLKGARAAVAAGGCWACSYFLVAEFHICQIFLLLNLYKNQLFATCIKLILIHRISHM